MRAWSHAYDAMCCCCEECLVCDSIISVILGYSGCYIMLMLMLEENIFMIIWMMKEIPRKWWEKKQNKDRKRKRE